MSKNDENQDFKERLLKILEDKDVKEKLKHIFEQEKFKHIFDDLPGFFLVRLIRRKGNSHNDKGTKNTMEGYNDTGEMKYEEANEINSFKGRTSPESLSYENGPDIEYENLKTKLKQVEEDRQRERVEYERVCKEIKTELEQVEEDRQRERVEYERACKKWQSERAEYERMCKKIKTELKQVKEDRQSESEKYERAYKKWQSKRDEYERACEKWQSEVEKQKKIVSYFQGTCDIYKRVQDLSPDIKKRVCAYFLPKETPISFLVCAGQENNLFSLWDIIKEEMYTCSEQDKVILQELLDYSIQRVNDSFKVSRYALLSNKVGERFDDYFHSRSRDSRPYSGRIEKVILPGIERMDNEEVKRKSVVKVACE